MYKIIIYVLTIKYCKSIKFCEKQERDVLFHDTLNTFINGYMASDIIMVKDHSDSEKGNPLPPNIGYSSINSKGSFISHRQDSTYQSLEREIVRNKVLRKLG